MAQRRFHYDLAFEHYLRTNNIPYISVDEAERSLVPGINKKLSLKSFDFVVYNDDGTNLLIDVKGRKHAASHFSSNNKSFQNWVTEDDIKSLTKWSHIFGSDFKPVFVFLFWCDTQPPDSLFHDIYEFNDRWYVMSAVDLSDYCAHTKPRSAAWGTVSVPTKIFRQISHPLTTILHPPHAPF